MYELDWQHFSAGDFADLQARLRASWQEILPGGEYYGQIRICDVCYDIQAEWLDCKAYEDIFVTMSPFFPHDADSAEEPYQEMVAGMPFDTADDASIVYAKEDFLAFSYLRFCDDATQKIQQMLQKDVFAKALAQDTNFWERHDEKLRQKRGQADE
ncbi:hypothetical protein [Selenomonas sp.]|uniref:hypothetical protein n=1 Tax=Selenomonas sp. TaxID=2053611 RepID=UPI0025E0EC1F|nr:hypothetical protein [Selenomonas sp.]MBQ1866888.1 hypothetical protein [Selenomonas sp.]